MYVEIDLPIDTTPFMALLATVDLAPGSGGSRMTPCGRVRVPDVCRGQGSLVALYPSSQLVAHCDPPIAGTRYHVPLVVNSGCWVFHRGVWQQLAVGRAYMMDPTAEHGAVNWGTERRVHLIVDTED